MRGRVPIAAFARNFFITFAVTLGVLDIVARAFTGGGIAGPTFSAEASPTHEPITPVRITVEHLGIDALVEHVGVNKNGNMAVPSSYSTTAWYKPGPRPGERGNAVIAGHRDNSLGLPGVFTDLADIERGDTITLADAEGKTLRFVVTRLERHPYSDAPLESIFAVDGEPQLVLITCDGEWDSSARSYEERLIVYASLAS